MLNLHNLNRGKLIATHTDHERLHVHGGAFQDPRAFDQQILLNVAIRLSAQAAQAAQGEWWREKMVIA